MTVSRTDHKPRFAPEGLGVPNGQDWRQLTDELIGGLTFCADCLGREETVANERAQAVAAQTLLSGVSKGIAQAGNLIERLRQRYADEESEGIEAVTSFSQHPLVRLAQTYLNAFEAVGVVSLLVFDMPLPQQMRATAVKCVSLALQAARELRRAINLVFASQGLGTVADSCAHIGRLENQADAAFQTALIAIFGQPSGEHVGQRWTQNEAGTLRLLLALEALTDRCEEIAEMLLLVEVTGYGVNA